MISRQCAKRDGRWLIRVERSVRMRAGFLLVAGVFATVAIALWYPSSWLPACPFYKHTGFLCPGCGSVRATHHILNGRFGDGVRHNLMLILIGLPLAAWYWGEQVAIVTSGYRFRALMGKQIVAWAALVGLLVFAVVRNLPGEQFEVLRPPNQSTSP